MASAIPKPVKVAEQEPDRESASSSSEELTPTERLLALGVDDEVVFSGSADEVIAWIEAGGPCESST